MGMRKLALAVAAIAGLAVGVQPAMAEKNKVRLINLYALTLLPHYIVQDKQLIEKHAAELGLTDVTVEFSRTPSAATANEALLTDTVDIVHAAMGPLLTIWDKTSARNKVKGMLGTAVYSQTLYTVDPRIKSLDDFQANDRIAMTDVKTSTQALILQMQAAKQYGWDNRFRYDPNMIAMDNNEGVAALLSGHTEVKSQMLTVPYSYIVEQAGARKIFTAKDLFGEMITATVLYGNQKFVDENPVLYQAVIAAFEEANEFVRNNKEEAAKIYVKYEPQKDGADFIVKLLQQEDTFRFSTTPIGFQRFADYMYESGLMKNKVEKWTDVFFDNVAGKPGN
jgi:NitT/TauT family transport system substrate-binding protein